MRRTARRSPSTLTTCRLSNNLAVALADQHQWAEAESLLVRATRLGRGQSFYNNLIQVQVAQGHMADARASLDRFAKASPQSPALQLFSAGMAMVERDYGTAEQALHDAQAAAEGSPYWSESRRDFWPGSGSDRAGWTTPDAFARS